MGCNTVKPTARVLCGEGNNAGNNAGDMIVPFIYNVSNYECYFIMNHVPDLLSIC